MTNDAPIGKQSFIHKHIELIVAILLGLVAIVTAYASFQSSLYDGNMTQSYTTGSNLATEAESIYLEANQQYVQDAQLYDRLTDLALDAANPDPAIATAAQEKYDLIYFQSVSAEFDAAIQWAAAENEADPELYYSPLDNEDYQDFLFSSYYEMKDEAKAIIAKGDEANTLSDKLTLNTVLMAVSLFLLGVAAVIQKPSTRIILAGVATAIFVTAAILTAMIPMLWVG